MSRSFATSLLLATLAWTGGVREGRADAPQDTSELEKEYVEQAVQYADGQKYDEASLSYATAYALSRRPGLLFDMARMELYRPGEHTGEAQTLFVRFLQESKRTPMRAEAEGYLARLRKKHRPAHPRSPDLMKGYVEQATTAFSMGDYEKASRAFATAYALGPAPLLLFNLAQVQRKMGQNKAALAFYQRFLQDDPKTSMRAEAESFIAMLRKDAGRKAEEDKAPPRPAPQAAPVIAVPPAGPAPALAGKGRPRPLRVAKWVLGAAGLLAVAAGAALWALDGYQSCPLASVGRCARELDSLTAGVVVLSAGGVLVGSSILMFGLDARREPSGPRTAMLSLALRF